MTDKAKERIQRQCNHLTLLRVKHPYTDEWLEHYMCADCDLDTFFPTRWPVLEKSAT